MNELCVIVYLLPVVFMFHDFEEIIGFQVWFKKNRLWLSEKYPRISKRILVHFENTSTASFSLAVAEEFIIISAATFYSVYSGHYYLWLGAFIAFFMHLIMHLVQWLFIRKYIPAILTTLVCLPYCCYSFIKVAGTDEFSLREFVFCSVIGISLTIINLMMIHTVISHNKIISKTLNS